MKTKTVSPTTEAALEALTAWVDYYTETVRIGREAAMGDQHDVAAQLLLGLEAEESWLAERLALRFGAPNGPGGIDDTFSELRRLLVPSAGELAEEVEPDAVSALLAVA
jgi:hypothetical protein